MVVSVTVSGVTMNWPSFLGCSPLNATKNTAHLHDALFDFTAALNGTAF